MVQNTNFFGRRTKFDTLTLNHIDIKIIQILWNNQNNNNEDGASTPYSSPRTLSICVAKVISEGGNRLTWLLGRCVHWIVKWSDLFPWNGTTKCLLRQNRVCFTVLTYSNPRTLSICVAKVSSEDGDRLTWLLGRCFHWRVKRLDLIPWKSTTKCLLKWKSSHWIYPVTPTAGEESI